MSLSWYTWLEQGRDIHASAQVLCAISRALRLEPVERAHLFSLARRAPTSGDASEAVAAAHRRVLSAWEPYPAHITGRRWDLLAWNRAASLVFGDYAQLPDGRRNILWTMFALPDRRRRIADWKRQAERMVATFRADSAQYLEDPDVQELITELREQSPEFNALWARQDVHGRTEGHKRLRHPELGPLEFEHTTYHPSDRPALRVNLYAPAPGSRTDTVLRDLDLDAHFPPSFIGEPAAMLA